MSIKKFVCRRLLGKHIVASLQDTDAGGLLRCPASWRLSYRTSDLHKKTDIPNGISVFGAGGRTRTGTLSLAGDFGSTTSTNSITPAGTALLYAIYSENARPLQIFLTVFSHMLRQMLGKQC